MLFTKKIFSILAVFTFAASLFIEIQPNQNEVFNLKISAVYASEDGWDRETEDCTFTDANGNTVNGEKSDCPKGNEDYCRLALCHKVYSLHQQ